MFFTISLSFSFVSFSFCLLIICSLPFLLATTPPTPSTFCRKVAFAAFFSFTPLSFTSSNSSLYFCLPLVSSSITQVLSSKGDDRGMLTSLVLTLHSSPLRYICALTGGAGSSDHSPSLPDSVLCCMTDRLPDRPWLTHCFCCLSGGSTQLPPLASYITAYGRLVGWLPDTMHSCMLIPITLC